MKKIDRIHIEKSKYFSNQNHINRLFFCLLLCSCLVLSWFLSRNLTQFDDPSGLWADKAGYYIYLPTTFLYHFDTRRIPTDLDIRTGGGFAIDTTRNKIYTKYTCGVAILQSPFFFTAWVISSITGYDHENGFSMIYIRILQLAGVVWFVFGMWYLKRFLDHYFEEWVNLSVILLLFLGTNLFYYVIIDGLMSHVYSLFLFALFLYSLKRFIDSASYRYFIWMILALGMATLVRPTNILLISLIFFWDAANRKEIIRRVRQFIHVRYLLVFLLIVFLIWIPQMIYWKYLSGHWLHFSYLGEGFDNWRHPRIMEVLISPLNGLFIHAPVMLFCVLGIVYMIIAKKPNGWLIAAIFATVTLISASWYMWYFGCSYGQRNFVEYLTIFAVPLGCLLTRLVKSDQRFEGSVAGAGLSDNRTNSSIQGSMDPQPPAGIEIKTTKKIGKVVLNSLISFLFFLAVYYNLRYTCSLYRYERCYFGSTWDWDHYLRSLERAGIIEPLHYPKSYKNDFENLALSPVFKPSKIFSRSGQYSIAADESRITTPLFTLSLEEIYYPFPKMIDVSVWAIKPGTGPTEASLSYRLKRDTSVVFTDRVPLDPLIKQPMTWIIIRKSFIIPDLNDSVQRIEVFIENPMQSVLFVDDLEIKYHFKWGNFD